MDDSVYARYMPLHVTLRMFVLCCTALRRAAKYGHTQGEVTLDTLVSALKQDITEQQQVGG